MTTPEEIEEILNTHGDTLRDLPTSYDIDRLMQAYEMAGKWTRGQKPMTFNFICHQSDVIEKLVAALKKESWEDEFLLD